MASRSSSLSLKARAIALLAQREHSVAELRRKLLRLAQLRDLQAWEAEQGVPAGARLTGEPSALPGMPQASRAIGSFDLAEDWGEGELDAFLEGWDAAPAALDDEGAPLLTDLTGDTSADLRSVVHGEPAGMADVSQGRQGREGRTDPHRQGRLDGPAAAECTQRRARERTSRGAVAPSPEARQAIMDEERQQARAEEVEQLLQWLQQRAYLSEARLVESRINARAARYGNLRIQQELRQLGVAPDEAQQARLKESELERARDVWQRKFGGEAPVDAASRARQMRFLAARGFSSEVVRRVLRGEDE